MVLTWGTILDETAPKLQSIPKEFVSETGISEQNFSQFLLYSIDQLMKENFRIADDQIPAQKILKKAIAKFNVDLPIETLEEAAFHLLGGSSTDYLKPIPHAVSLLKELKDTGAIIIALSNTAIPLSVLKFILEIHNLNQYFYSIILSSECGWRKPCPRAFEQMENAVAFSSDDFMIFYRQQL